MFMPWKLKRKMLISFLGYKIHPQARIGLSWIYPTVLVMERNSRIGHFNVAIHLDKVIMDEYSSISRGNWITGFSTLEDSKHFVHQQGDRQSVLKIGKHSAITKNHHLDCTNIIKIGSFTTIAGYSSQFLTHSIDIYEGRQSSAPIEIGDYCFISTSVVILGGASLPSYCVLGAKSLLNKQYIDSYKLYAGMPAKPSKDLPCDAKYFTREIGFIY